MAQYGRTFEDRSHVFEVLKRPDSLYCKERVIHNLNVRGRRGNIVQVYPSVEYDPNPHPHPHPHPHANIVQVYPSVEYDFVPNKVELYEGDCIHFQWTGSDANNNGNAGNGRRMTDRSNLVEIAEPGKNVPIKYGFDDPTRQHKQTGLFGADEALYKRFAYLGQEVTCTADGVCEPSGLCDDNEDNQQSLSNCKQLNAASAYFDAGPIAIHDTEFAWGNRRYFFMSTRNNAFTNRSQKGSIVVIAWKAYVIIASSIVATAISLPEHVASPHPYRPGSLVVILTST